MKNLFIIFTIILFGCNKQNDFVNSKPIQNSVPYASKKVPANYYAGKTSYQLKNPIEFYGVSEIRTRLGVAEKGMYGPGGNVGYTYIDINNDGFEDIFYPYRSNDQTPMLPDIFLRDGLGNYKLGNPYDYFPENYKGNILTRKTLVGDFNNDNLPDLFLINSGYDGPPWPFEYCTLLLSDKITNKFKLGDLSKLPKAFWHGGASGDLNGDGNIDIIVLDNNFPKLLYGDGNGNFNIKDWDYKAGNGYITAEIVDVDKDGKNDIILSGDETNDYSVGKTSPSTIFFNDGNNFSSRQIIICKPNLNGRKYVMDISVEDLDNDGINEIILTRTGDGTNGIIWYGGYELDTYKTTDNFKSFNQINIITNPSHIVPGPWPGNWAYRVYVYNENQTLKIQASITFGYGKPTSTYKIWTQNKQTFKFE